MAIWQFTPTMVICAILLLVVSASSQSGPESCATEDVKGVVAPSALQRSATYKTSLAVPLLEDEADLHLEAKVAENVEAATEMEDFESGGSQVEVYNGVQLILHDGSEVAATGSGRWVITVPENCTTADVDKMAEHMPNGSTPEFKGDPDKGGLCVFVMSGTKKQVQEELDTHDWPSTPTVETDKTWKVIPDLDVEDGDSLLEKEGAEGASAPKSWGLDRIDDRTGLDSDYTPPAGQTGLGVHVFVADTGVMTSHRDFGGRAVPTLEVLSSTRKVCSPTDTSCATDRHGHGTHCAGTIGGAEYGVAKEATLHAVKVLSDGGGGSFSWFIEALDWVMTSRLRPAVFSASLGGRGNVHGVKVAITNAVAGGVTVVVAAGNSGRSSMPDACSYSPAYVPAAITVGATDSSDQRASYSSYGSCLDIFAPGSSIKSAGHRSDTATATMSGTSMACPHVAGGAALILGEDSTRTPADVIAVMLSRSTVDAIKDTKAGSPNQMLYTGLDTQAPTPAPPPTPAPTPSPTPSPTPLPPVPPALGEGSCSFESGFAGSCDVWSNAKSGSDNFDWTIRSGSTPSSRTGPGSAADGQKYIYIETSYPRKSGELAVLQSRPLVLNGSTALKFKYHMYGQSIGSLKVSVGQQVLFSKSGNQGNKWLDGRVDLSNFTGALPVIRITGVRGGSWTGDIAIDKVEFEAIGPTPSPTPAPPTPMVIVTTVGSSYGANTKCVQALGRFCPPDSGDRYKRVNRDHWNAADDFTVTMTGDQVCAERQDAKHGWGMNLQLACFAVPTPAPTPAPPTPPMVVTTVGRSYGVNTKCVQGLHRFCFPDSGDRYKRVNRDHWNAADSFTVTMNGDQVCAERQDAKHGWGMNLQLACFATPPAPAPMR